VAEGSARGGFLLMSGEVLSTVVLAISSILVGRFLGPELYGQYALVLVIPQLSYLFADLGISQGVTKFTASFNSRNEEHRVTKIVRYALLLKTLAGMVLFIINFAFADALAAVVLQRPDLAYCIRIASLSILFQAVFSTATYAFVGLDRAEYLALSQNIQAFSKTTISILLVFLGFGVAGAVMGLSISFALAALGSITILLLILRKKPKATDNRDSPDDLRSLVSYGIPLYAFILLIGFIPFFQNVVLANFATDAEIGNYKAASNFATLLTTLSTPITSALLPAFSKIDSSARTKIRLFFKLANKYTAMLIFPATVLLITYSPQIVQIIYGSTYQSAPLFLAIQSLLYFTAGLGYLTLTSLYNGFGETKITLTMGLATFVTIVVLSPILTQIYGVLGLIAAFLLASLTGTSYGLLKAKRKFKISLDYRSLSKIYAVSAGCIVPSILMSRLVPLSNMPSLAIGSVLYLFLYITMVPISGIVTQTELRKVSGIIQKTRPLRIIATPILEYQQRVLHRISVV
jgi:O-antigen/teichoic acid export membrane protein